MKVYYCLDTLAIVHHNDWIVTFDENGWLLGVEEGKDQQSQWKQMHLGSNMWIHKAIIQVSRGRQQKKFNIAKDQVKIKI